MLLAKDTCKVEGCKFETEMGTKLEAFVRVKLYHEQVHTKKEDIGQILEKLTQKQKQERKDISEVRKEERKELERIRKK